MSIITQHYFRSIAIKITSCVLSNKDFGVQALSHTCDTFVPPMPAHHYYSMSISIKKKFYPSASHVGNNTDKFNNTVKLSGNVIMDENRQLFKSIDTITNYVKMFFFGDNCLIV